MPTFRDFVDERDGQVYTCTLMPDGKWWAAKNLNFSGGGSYYNNDPANAADYGRLYTWDEARALIPAGTHIPTNAEWTTMLAAIPGTTNAQDLRSTTLWTPGGTSLDTFGFKATPGGYRNLAPSYANKGTTAYFWTADEFAGTQGLVRSIYYTSTTVGVASATSKGVMQSVRFIVDDFFTYRPYTDARDGKTYQCVKMPDGQWWATTNLAWDGAGVPHNDTANYGRLYTLTEALAACPAGCHIPTEAEWTALGITSADQLKKNSALWTTNTGTNDYGFSALPAGFEYNGTIGSVGTNAYINLNTVSGSNWSLASISTGTVNIGQGYDPVRFSVRFVLDRQPSIFGVEFDGFERGMTVSIQRPIQVVDSIGGSVKLIPYGTAELDEWRVETEFWVNAERASELEPIVPPYGVPQTTDMYLPPRSGSASFPGLRPALQGSSVDKYIYPQVTRFESQGRKGPIVDLFGYFMDFTLRAWADGQATNQASTPTTTLPTWLEQKFAARQIQDWSVQTATVYSGGFRSTYLRSKHGRRKDVNFNLDHLTATQANELVAFFRGVRHNVTTITCDNGPDGQQSISVYLVGLQLHRTGLHWDGTLETVLA